MTYFSTVLDRIKKSADNYFEGHEPMRFDFSFVLSLSEKHIHLVESDPYVRALINIVQTLEKSPTAHALLGFLADRGFGVSFGALQTAGQQNYVAAFDKEAKTIYLDRFGLIPDVNLNTNLIIALAHHLRRAWQAEQGLGAHSLDVPIMAFTRAYRREEADADACLIQIAWELRAAGEMDAWRGIIASPLGEMALIFAEYVDADPKSLFDGSALKAAYDMWGSDILRLGECDNRALYAQGYEDGFFVNKMRVTPYLLKRHHDIPDMQGDEDGEMIANTH